MTFSQKVKEEIISSFTASSEQSMLAGILLASGNLIISSSAISFCVSSESESVINFAQQLILNEEPSAELKVSRVRRNFKNKERIELEIDSASGERVLVKLGILEFDKNGNRQINTLGGNFLRIEKDAKLAFLSGLFLGSGSITIPSSVELEDISTSTKSSGYHFEWQASNENLARLICEELVEFDVFTKKVERNENFVIYIKESEMISNLLGLFGAHKCLLEFENERAGRQMRNLINRQANCTMANIGKSINAAMEQLEAIEIIRDTIGLESLPDSLAEVALARLTNPDGSLIDIANALPNAISKGAVSQRFKKLIQISKELKE